MFLNLFGKKSANQDDAIKKLSALAARAIAAEEELQEELKHKDEVVLYYLSRCRELEDALSACGKKLLAGPPPERRKPPDRRR